LTFNEMMSPEKRQLTVLENKKSEYAEAIQFLESRKKMLEKQEEAIRNSPEMKELIEAIDEEIDILKNEYFNNQSQINSMTKMSEGVGFTVWDTAEFLKKK